MDIIEVINKINKQNNDEALSKYEYENLIDNLYDVLEACTLNIEIEHYDTYDIIYEYDYVGDEKIILKNITIGYDKDEELYVNIIATVDVLINKYEHRELIEQEINRNKGGY